MKAPYQIQQFFDFRSSLSRHFRPTLGVARAMAFIATEQEKKAF